MKSWDVIIIGGGIIGLTLSIAVRKQGLRVLIVERGEPGREASSAAAGMLAGSGMEIPPALRTLAEASARMYPEFVHELEDESGVNVDLREFGTILLSSPDHLPAAARRLSFEELQALEPGVAVPGRQPDLSLSKGRTGLSELRDKSSSPEPELCAAFLNERSVDPQALVAAVVKAAKHRGVDISSGHEIRNVLLEEGRASGVETDKTKYFAGAVVNCAGAWAGLLGPVKLPVRPVKGQMLSLIGGPALKHVVRGDEVYVVPRTDGRFTIGSTLENVGYEKRTKVSTIQRLLHAAVELAPRLADAKLHQDWAGLRPGTPDELPILGRTLTPGYFVATGHYRDGILLAPVTAQIMTEIVLGQTGSHDLIPFSPSRFSE